MARDLSSMHAPVFGLRGCLNFFGQGSTTLAKKIGTATHVKLQARACSRDHAPVPAGARLSQFFFLNLARVVVVILFILNWRKKNERG